MQNSEKSLYNIISESKEDDLSLISYSQPRNQDTPYKEKATP
jgi:hypothetical protein